MDLETQLKLKSRETDNPNVRKAQRPCNERGAWVTAPAGSEAAVRITNQLLSSRALEGTRKLMAEIGDLQEAITSGLRVARPSDDPTVVGSIMKTSSGLRSLDQYRDNLGLVQSRLSLEDGVTEQIADVLARAKELALSQGDATASSDTREAARKEVEALRDHLVDLGNTQFTGSYLFGGVYADSRPFTSGGTDPARPPAGDFTVEGGAGVYFQANHSGQELFVDTGALGALNNLIEALGNDSETEVRASIEGLDTAFDAVQSLTAELGARMNRVDRALENLDSLDFELQTQRSALQDMDFEEAVTKLTNRQVTYQAAMLANARILNMTLTDYLR